MTTAITMFFLVTAPTMLLRHVWRNRRAFDLSNAIIIGSVGSGAALGGALLYFGIV